MNSLKTFPSSGLSQYSTGQVGDIVKCFGRIYRPCKRGTDWFFILRSKEECQVVLPCKIWDGTPELYASIYLTGQIQLSPNGQQRELHVSSVDFYGSFPAKNIKIKWNMSPDKMRKLVSQRLLAKSYQQLVYFRSHLHALLNQTAMNVMNWVQVFVPFITFSDCEGAGETFLVQSTIKNFFTKQAFLTVSGQVDEETATCRLMHGTYIFGPSFRSDPSNTRYHACEFWHFEPEFPVSVDGHAAVNELMNAEEKLLKHIFKSVHDMPELQTLHSIYKTVPISADDLITYTKNPFARCSYTDAIKILQKASKKFKIAPIWGMDLGKEHERYLCEEHFKKPVFVYQFPSALKSFYMYQCDPFVDTEIGPQKLNTCLGVDLLIPGVDELCGGSVREYRVDHLLKTIADKKLNPEDYAEYIQLRREGTFPHAGFGLGVDRLIMAITGAPHIRDLTIFPRYYKCK